LRLLETISSISRFIMLIAAAIAIVEGIKAFKNLGFLKLILILCILSFLDTLSFSIFHELGKRNDIFINTAVFTQNVFIITELVSIIIFYSNTSLKPKMSISIFLISTITIAVIMFLKMTNPYRIISIELPILIFEVIFVNFFSGLFFLKNIEYNKSEFPKEFQIINKGFFIFINLTAPYYLISSLIVNNLSPLILALNFINDISYSILFYQFIKAFRCLQVKKN
jgi:hypothetical protein